MLPFEGATAFRADDPPGERIPVLVLASPCNTFFLAPLPDYCRHSFKCLPAHNGGVMVLHEIPVPLAVIMVAVELAVRVGLLEQDVPGELLIRQKSPNCRSCPAPAFPGSGTPRSFSSEAILCVPFPARACSNIQHTTSACSSLTTICPSTLS